MLKPRFKILLFLTLFALATSIFIPPAFAGEEPDTQTFTLSQEEAELFEIFSAVKEIIQEFHVKDIELKDVYQGAIRGLLEQLDDPYSIYIPEEALDSFNAGLEGEYGGVGLVIDLVDGMITVISVFPSTPAARAGVQAGDVIISVEDRDMTGKMPADAGELLRGEAGTEVKAVFKRPYTGETFYHTFEREKIVQPMMDVKDLGDGIWYIQIAQFTETVEDQIPTVVDVLRNIGVKGIVLDLRNNPGGYLSSCTSVAEALIPEGPIVELRRKELFQEIASTSDVEPVPMVVLVNRGTASAAEILAGAIRDRGVGILVGGSTFGKASVQSIIPLPEGLGAFKLTTAEYYTPSGISLHGDGLVPDIPVEPKSVVLPRKLVAGRTMKQGVIGLDVLQFQESLNFLGYDTGGCDGIYGAKTQKAVQEFARSSGIENQWEITQTYLDMLYVSVVQKVKDMPDEVLEAGLAALEKKLTTGGWW